MPRYQLVYGRPENFRVFFEHDSLWEVTKRREVSGDIILETTHSLTRVENGVLGEEIITTIHRQVVQGDMWLWDWEREDPSCYARRCQREGWRY